MKVTAEAVVRQSTSGRNKALQLFCRDDADRTHDVLVKLSARLTVPPREYLCEWVASAIARHLGVNVAEPYEVSISQEFANKVAGLHASDIKKSVGSAFGCRIEQGYIVVPTVPPVDEDLVEPLSELLIFDVLVHNVDRTRGNPNVLAKRSSLLAIDHDAAFAFLIPDLLGADPTSDPLLTMVQKHVTGGLLRGRMGSTERIVGALATITDAFLADLEAATPDAWRTGTAAGNVEEIVRVLKARRDCRDGWLAQVLAWMRAS